MPLVILAACAVLLGFVGTPAWPWLQSFLEGQRAVVSSAGFSEPGLVPVMLASSVIVLLGLGLGWWVYGRKPIVDGAADPIEELQPSLAAALGRGLYVDALYAATVVRVNGPFATISDALDRWVWGGAVWTVSHLVLGLAWVDNLIDTRVVNAGFDEGCRNVSRGGQLLSLLQGGRVQTYLRVIGVALVALTIFLLWGARA